MIAIKNRKPQADVLELVQSAQSGVTIGPPEAEQRECDAHGVYLSRKFRGLRIWSGCPKCSDERDAKSKTEESVKARAERAQAWKGRVDCAGIPERFKTRTLRNYVAELPGQQDALVFSTEYADGFAKVLSDGRCALFVGSVGTGKTHLAVGICLRIMHAGYTASFQTVREVIRRVRDTWSRGADETETQAIAALVCVDLLVLDEVGVQHGTEAEQLVLWDVLDGRYKARRPTLLLSNLTVPELEGYLGARIFDRLREDGGQVIPFIWASARGSELTRRDA